MNKLSNNLGEDICYDEVRLSTFPLLLMHFLELIVAFLGSGSTPTPLILSKRSLYRLLLSSSRKLNVSSFYLWLRRLFADWV
jgi:hypothetical protein